MWCCLCLAPTASHVASSESCPKPCRGPVVAAAGIAGAARRRSHQPRSSGPNPRRLRRPPSADMAAQTSESSRSRLRSGTTRRSGTRRSGTRRSSPRKSRRRIASDMRIIVCLGWCIYPIGYFFGAPTAGVDIADFVNNIGLVLSCWSCASSISSATIPRKVRMCFVAYKFEV